MTTHSSRRSSWLRLHERLFDCLTSVIRLYVACLCQCHRATFKKQAETPARQGQTEE